MRHEQCISAPASVGLNAGVLVLNKHWAAIDIAPLHKAISWLVSGEAQVAHKEEAWKTFDFQEWCDFGKVHNEIPAIATPNIRVPRPLVVRLVDCLYNKKQEHIKVAFTRSNIFIRDKYTCQYCGEVFPRQQLNLDHVIPRHQKGHTNWTNIVCSCFACNTFKANRTPEQAGMRLLRKPVEPKWIPIRVDHIEWNDFLSQAYWCVPLALD